MHFEEPAAAIRREVVHLHCRLAALHAQLAWVNNQNVTTQEPLANAKRARIRNKKVSKPIKPGNAKMDKSLQTEVLPEKIDTGQQTEASISELKHANRKTIEELREPLRRCIDALSEVILYVDTLVNEKNLDVRPPSQDATVLSVVEKYGCQNRRAFDETLQELFGDHFVEWRPRLHNSLLRTIRMNKISCFGRRPQKRKPKSKGSGVLAVLTNEDHI